MSSEPLHRKDNAELVSEAVNAVTAGDWARAAELAKEADSRSLGPPAEFKSPSPDPGSASIGDEFVAVVVHPNSDPDDPRDPVAKVNGKTTFIRYPNKDNDHVNFGDRVRVRLADKRSDHNLAVALEEL